MIEINAEIAVRENLVRIAQERTCLRMQPPQFTIIGGRLVAIVDVEKLTADLEKGVLRVTLPKRTDTIKAEKRIRIGEC